MRQIISLLLVGTILLQPLQPVYGGTVTRSPLPRMSVGVERILAGQALVSPALWLHPFRAWQKLPAHVRASAALISASIASAASLQFVSPTSEFWFHFFILLLTHSLMSITVLFSEPRIPLSMLNLPESRIDGVDWIARIERKIKFRFPYFVREILVGLYIAFYREYVPYITPTSGDSPDYYALHTHRLGERLILQKAHRTFRLLGIIAGLAGTLAVAKAMPDSGFVAHFLIGIAIFAVTLPLSHLLFSHVFQPLRAWYVRRNGPPPPPAGSAGDGSDVGAPESLDDFARVFGTKEALGANMTSDVLEALAAEWDADKRNAVIRRMRNELPVHRALEAIRDGNRRLMERFQQANPGKGPGKVVSELARQTHESYMNLIRGDSNFVTYNRALHELMREQVKAGVVQFQDPIGSWIPISLAEFENPKKKFKIKAANMRWASDAEWLTFDQNFAEVTGRPFTGALVNTVAGDWDELHLIEAEHEPEVWREKRPVYLFGLQSDAVAAILRTLHDHSVMVQLTSENEATRMAAIVLLLRQQNAGWRVNNSYNGYQDRLQYLPFALEEEGGIGIGDILKDAVVNKGVLETLHQFILKREVAIDPSIARNLELAFSRGFGHTLQRSVMKEHLTDAVRTNPVPVGFVHVPKPAVAKVGAALILLLLLSNTAIHSIMHPEWRLSSYRGFTVAA